MSDVASQEVLWDRTALRLLEARDRYTRAAVLKEFEPRGRSIEVEASSQRLTPVADGTLGVLWERDASLRVIVRAIVPLPSNSHVESISQTWIQSAVNKAEQSLLR